MAASKKKTAPRKTQAIRDAAPAAVIPEDRPIGTLMRLTLAKLRERLRDRLAAEGLPWGIWLFIRTLWEEDELTQRDLTTKVGLRQPTTVVAVRSMERLGLVRLKRDEQDRRKVYICLTDKGKKLRDKLLPDVANLNNKVALRGFTAKESEELKRLLTKMHGNLSD